MRYLLSEPVEAMGRNLPIASTECGGELVSRGAARAGGEQAERDVEGERGGGGVAGGRGGVAGGRGGCGQGECGGEVKCETCLACDREMHEM